VAEVLPLADEIADELPGQIIKNQSLINIAQTINNRISPKAWKLWPGRKSAWRLKKFLHPIIGAKT